MITLHFQSPLSCSGYQSDLLPRSVLKVLLEFARKGSHFIFNGQYYDQIDGVAMGSPLGLSFWPTSLCAILKRSGPLTTVGSYLLLNTKFHWLYSVVLSIVS